MNTICSHPESAFQTQEYCWNVNGWASVSILSLRTWFRELSYRNIWRSRKRFRDSFTSPPPLYVICAIVGKFFDFEVRELNVRLIDLMKLHLTHQGVCVWMFIYFLWSLKPLLEPKCKLFRNKCIFQQLSFTFYNFLIKIQWCPRISLFVLLF